MVTLHISRCSLAFVFALISSTGNALELGDVQIHGFISQRLVLTQGNNYLSPDSQGGTFDGGEAGLSAFYRPMDPLYLSGRVVSQNLGDHLENNLEVDQLFVGVIFLSKRNRDATLMAGRFPMPFGIYGETDDVPSAYTSIILPLATYSEYGRDSLLNMEGLQLEYNERGDWGSISLNFSVGDAVSKGESLSKELPLIYPDYRGASIDYYRYRQYRLYYYAPSERWSLRFSRLFWGYGAYLDLGTVLIFPNVTGQVNFLAKADIVSFQYDSNNWTLTAEYHAIDFETETTTWVSGAFFSRQFAESTGYQYFVQLEYVLNPQMTIYTRFQESYRDKNDRAGNNLAYPPNYAGYAHIASLGTAYKIDQGWLLKMEWHNWEGAYGTTATENLDRSQVERYWNVFAAQLSYGF